METRAFFYENHEPKVWILQESPIESISSLHNLEVQGNQEAGFHVFPGLRKVTVLDYYNTQTLKSWHGQRLGWLSNFRRLDPNNF